MKTQTTGLRKCSACGWQVRADDPVCTHCGIHSAASNLPSCPTCGSGRVERITAGQKTGSLLLTGPFAVRKSMRSYRCHNCKAMW